jgi:hypothetical protein
MPIKLVDAVAGANAAWRKLRKTLQRYEPAVA